MNLLGGPKSSTQTLPTITGIFGGSYLEVYKIEGIFFCGGKLEGQKFFRVNFGRWLMHRDGRPNNVLVVREDIPY